MFILLDSIFTFDFIGIYLILSVAEILDIRAFNLFKTTCYTIRLLSLLPFTLLRSILTLYNVYLFAYLIRCLIIHTVILILKTQTQVLQNDFIQKSTSKSFEAQTKCFRRRC